MSTKPLTVGGFIFVIAVAIGLNNLPTNSEPTSGDSTLKRLSTSVATPPPVSQVSYSAANLRTIVDASRNNEVRFRRDFKGHTYRATMAFSGISKEILWGYMVTFTDGTYCSSVTDTAVTDQIADWRRGRQVTVTGVIEDTVLSNLMLKNCQFS